MKKKKILLTGANGHMGRMIQSCSEDFDDIEVIAGVDINDKNSGGLTIYKTLDNVTFPVDVLIDYSHPSLLDSVLSYSLKYKVPAVIATTGLSQEQKDNIKEASEECAIFFSANMSLGINLISELLKKAAPVLKDTFDIEIVEKHHNRKLDAPSGTALLLADTINSSVDVPYQYIYDRHSVRKARDKKEIGIHSIRGGTIVGDHDVIFAGDDEIITISHSAQSRRVFANGSLEAAHFIAGKEKGLYSMPDLISDKIKALY